MNSIDVCGLTKDQISIIENIVQEFRNSDTTKLDVVLAKITNCKSFISGSILKFTFYNENILLSYLNNLLKLENKYIILEWDTRTRTWSVYKDNVLTFDFDKIKEWLIMLGQKGITRSNVLIITFNQYDQLKHLSV